MQANHPRTGKTYFFVDKCLPFGHSISCMIFQSFSDALTHVMVYRTGFVIFMTNYLDDFLMLALSIQACNHYMRQFIQICETIGCPTSEEKTEWGSAMMEFLGMLLNGKTFTVSVPLDKITKALSLLNWVVDNSKITIKMVQRLTGILNFLHRAVVPGRTFTRSMYDKLKIRNKQGQLLQQHHHVSIGKQFKLDAKVWRDFLMDRNLDHLCRPFIDFSDERFALTLNFYTDAAKSGILGMGAVYNNHWMFTSWPIGWIEKEDPSIEFLELYAFTAAILAWGKEIRNCRVTIFNDNQAVIGMINKLTSRCPQCMKLIRILVLDCIHYNRRLFVQFVPSKQNILADSLSRLNFRRFWHHAPMTMDEHPTDLPDKIWPLGKIWFD